MRPLGLPTSLRRRMKMMKEAGRAAAAKQPKKQPDNQKILNIPKAIPAISPENSNVKHLQNWGGHTFELYFIFWVAEHLHTISK